MNHKAIKTINYVNIIFYLYNMIDLCLINKIIHFKSSFASELQQFCITKFTCCIRRKLEEY